MSKPYEEAVHIWAGRKLGVPAEHVVRVAIVTDSGWGGTDITAGESPSCTVTAWLTDGSSREVLDLFRNEDGSRSRMYDGRAWDFAELLREILEAGS